MVAGRKLQVEEQTQGIGVGGQRRPGWRQQGAGSLCVALLGTDAGQKQGGLRILRGQWFGQLGGHFKAALCGQSGCPEEHRLARPPIARAVERLEGIAWAAGGELRSGEEEPEHVPFPRRTFAQRLFKGGNGSLRHSFAQGGERFFRHG